MAQQLACVMSTIRGPADGFKPHFVRAMQDDERYSGSITRLPDGSTIPNTKDFIPGDDDLITAAGLTLCYVYADETRVTAADSNANYHVLWCMYTQSPFTTSQFPHDNMPASELSALQTYLSDRLGYTGTQITNWLISKFEVANQSEAVAWATSRPRTATVTKLMVALSHYADAQGELAQ